MADENPKGGEPGGSGIEHRAFQALPRDPEQPEHKKPRIFVHRPDEDPEAAEEARRNATYFEAAKTIKLEDFKKVPQTPCARDALLPAIGGGAGVGAVRFISGASVLKACNWATGSFVLVAFGAYHYCQRRRQLEKDQIRKVVQVLDAKQAIKDARENGGQPPGQAPAPSSAYQQGNQNGVSFWDSFKFW